MTDSQCVCGSLTRKRERLDLVATVLATLFGICSLLTTQKQKHICSGDELFGLPFLVYLPFHNRHRDIAVEQFEILKLGIDQGVNIIPYVTT